MYNSDLIKYYELGMERETLRINRDGFSALTPHPFPGDAHMERDFCENQLEIITDVHTDVDELLQEMKTRHETAVEKIKPQGEILWPMSNPAYVPPEDEIPIAQYLGEKAYKTEYRNYLAKKYGRKKMLFSGIHLNYSIPEGALRDLYQYDSHLQALYQKHLLHCKMAPDNFTHFKNFVYLSLAANVTEVSWLISYLTAASPLMDMSFYGGKTGETERNKYSSYRLGPEGYWNTFTPMLDYTSLDAYIESIERLVDCGRIQSPWELYIPVRLKNLGENSLDGLRQNGINHIELRMFDLNPLAEDTYIDEMDVRFTLLLLVYLISQEPIASSKEAQEDAIINMKNAVSLHEKKTVINHDGNSIPVRQAAGDYLDEMAAFFAGNNYALDLIKYQKNKLNPGQSYAEIISKKYPGDFVQEILDEYI